MDAIRWQRVNELFHAAINHAAEERRAWLVRACNGDESLAVEVERLVQAHERAANFVHTDDSPDAIHVLSAHREVPIGREFTGSGRFAVLRTLGVGGMGVVYEVHDRARNEHIALKTLLRTLPADLYRLKREFRSLADVAHVNLVSLYELFVDGEECFFTMELVDGVNFVQAARAGDGNHDRLRLLFEQLVDGVSELHRQGKLHRDIKPSNVLVTPAGRVVILDFGLIAERAAPVAGLDDSIAGTPAYMSPEQAIGTPASEASDWYGVGVTLYEALTGRLPFTGTFSEMRGAKTVRDPPAPFEVAGGIPDDLSAVCLGLLCRDPDRRLRGSEALARLGDRSRAAAGIRPARTVFVGRDRQLDVLRDSFELTCHGRTAAVCVCGPSGIGKSALVRQFLNCLPREQVLVFSGRCYENESVPYKALDGVVDNLSQYLASLPSSSLASLIPGDMPALARLFPVLRQIEPASEAVVESDPDPIHARRRAFAALRELLARMAAARPVIVAIDDLQWADADSAVLLEELLRPPGAPPVLVVACLRSEAIASKPFLGGLLEAGEAVAVTLAPLTEDEAHELVTAVVPRMSRSDPDDTRRIVGEAAGNPFFLEQLAEYAAVHEGANRAVRMTLAEMLDTRLRGLPAGAREFLDTLALCGRPMAPALIHAAAGHGGDERALVTSLRSVNLVRRSGSRDRVEIYHDRIRETLTAQMNPEGIRLRHRAVADALVASGVDDPEALFEHYRGAGERGPASLQAAHAADKAARALAFDRAVVFYRVALDLAPGTEQHAEWKERLATALANAGRPADAAAVYLDAAADAIGAQRLELRRRAADQFLSGGHIDRGLEVIRTVLDAEGMRLAPGPRSALVSVLLQRAYLRWRGLQFVERQPQAIPPDVLRRIDACWSVTTGMAMFDNVRALDFQTRHLLLALDAGEPVRIARALALEAAAFHGPRGGPGQRSVARFSRLASEMSERVGDPHAIALSTMAAGMGALLNGQWTQASLIGERALTLLRDTCVGVTWELNLAQFMVIGALLYRGEIQEVARRLSDVLTTAKDCGNLYLEAELRTRLLNLVLLANDDPNEADRQGQEVMRRWWSGGFTRQHYNHLLGRATTALYRGDPETAWRAIVENAPSIKRTLMTRIQLVRIELSFLRGRCAMALAADVTSGSRGAAARRHFTSIVRREARQLAREKMPWSDGFALLLRAGLAFQDGNTDSAEQHLARAVATFERADMQHYVAAASRRLGLLQGSRGRAHMEKAETWMARQLVRNPRLMTRMLTPGFPDA